MFGSRSDKVISHFSRMAQHWGIDQISPIDKCIFIAGIPRSGTTACQTIITEALRESGALPAPTTSGEGVTESFYFESENDPQNEAFLRAKLAFLGGRTKYVDMFNFIEHIRPIHQLKIDSNDMSRIYFEFSRQFYRLSIPCEKTPSNVLFARRIFQNSRHSLLLFLVRHPASIFGSMFRRALLGEHEQEWLNKGAEEFAWFFKLYVDKYYEMKLRYGRRVVLLRCEDLCLDSALLLETVAQNLGADVLCGSPTSRFREGASDVGIPEGYRKSYKAVQERILGDTMEYLKYEQLPSP